MRPPLSGALVIAQLFGGNPAYEAYVNARGQRVIGHDGLDIAAVVGQPVFPAWQGLLHVIDDGGKGFGLHAFVTDTVNKRWALYAHLSVIWLKNGDFVRLHSQFAAAGSSGNSTGPHVHFGVYHSISDNGYGGAVDPITDFDRDVWPLLDLSRTNL